MKDTLKKFFSILLLVVLVFSIARITNAFQHIDVCNYTNGDHSGDYYDGLCTKDGKPAEVVNKYNPKVDKDTEYKKPNKKHALKPVPHNTGSAVNFANIQSSKKISLLEKSLKEKDELIKKYKEENNKLIEKQSKLVTTIKLKDLYIKKLIEENEKLRKYIQNNLSVKETKVIIIKKQEDNFDVKTAAEKIREKIKKRNALLNK